VLYWEGATRVCYAKRFRVEKFIMDREYNLFPAKKGAKILHMSQGNGILLEVSFVPTPRIRKSKDIFFLDDLVIKGIQARGNKVSSKSVQSVKDIPNKKNADQELPLPEEKPHPMKELLLPEEPEN
ncbi:MAG: hypothetical protein VX985_03450, partial [SAR324 cluster bacterium]|nr:hypothetical protein [SAR324 cluster bacterium]